MVRFRVCEKALTTFSDITVSPGSAKLNETLDSNCLVLSREWGNGSL